MTATISLRDEVILDPLGRGYAGMTDAEVVNSLNAINREVEREYIESWEVIEATIWAEWNALSSAYKQLYQTLVSCSRLKVFGPNTRSAFAAMFGAGTTTRANLLALQTRLVSRAEELSLGNVTEGDVATVRQVGWPQ